MNQFIAVECVCELPCGYERYPDGNTSYKIYTYGLTWDEARDECASEGAKLAIATTFEKIEYIQNRGEAGKSLWIGIHRPEGIGGDWVRIDTGKFRHNLKSLHARHVATQSGIKTSLRLISNH